MSQQLVSPYFLGQVLLTSLRAGFSLVEVASGAATRRERYKMTPDGEVKLSPEENVDASLATAKSHIRHLHELCDRLPDDVDLLASVYKKG